MYDISMTFYVWHIRICMTYVWHYMYDTYTFMYDILWHYMYDIYVYVWHLCMTCMLGYPICSDRLQWVDAGMQPYCIAGMYAHVQYFFMIICVLKPIISREPMSDSEPAWYSVTDDNNITRIIIIWPPFFVISVSFVFFIQPNICAIYRWTRRAYVS